MTAYSAAAQFPGAGWDSGSEVREGALLSSSGAQPVTFLPIGPQLSGPRSGCNDSQAVKGEEGEAQEMLLQRVWAHPQSPASLELGADFGKVDGWPIDSHSLPSWQDCPVHQTQSLVPEGGL